MATESTDVARVDPGTASVGPVPPDRNPEGEWGRYLLSLAPTLVVFLLLGVVAVWGTRTEWKFGNPFSRPGAAADAKEKGEGREAEVIPGPPATAGGCPLNGTRVRLTSAEVVGRVGLQVAPAENRPLAAVVSAPAELSYDETRLARLSPRVPGTAVRVEKQVGDAVRKGEVVALVDAAAVGKAKSDLLDALATLDLREKEAAATAAAAGKGAISEIQAERDAAAAKSAQARVLAVQQALANLGLPAGTDELRKLSPVQQAERLRLTGLPPEYAKALGPELASANLIPVASPLDGVVVERNVVPGEVVDTTKVLFVVADLNRVWALADVRTEDADRVALKQSLAFAANGHPGEVLTGPVVWTSTAIDPRTRTLRVRAEISNPGTHWRARTFGTARITLRPGDQPTTAVHPDAVQREGDCRYVFVRLDATTFEMRAVRLGVRGEVDARREGGGTQKEPRVEILDGVRPGEEVVTAGSYILKAEVLKGRLGDAH